MKQVFALTDSTKNRAVIIEAVMNAPIGHVVEIKPYSPKRTLPQNRLQWADMLGEFSKQVEIEGRRFDADVWHEHLKEKFLPESEQEGITLPGYAKWKEKPDGSMKLVGSTTKLTKLGMSNYLNECYAYGAQELGIRFPAREFAA